MNRDPVALTLADASAPPHCVHSNALPEPSGKAVVIQPVVFAGGAGTRLWPISREHFPKQLIDLFGTGSLLQAAARRLTGVSDHMPSDLPASLSQQTLVVCGAAHCATTLSQLRSGHQSVRLIVEPVARSTAPAMTAAALIASRDAPAGVDPILVAMPADHVIPDFSNFNESIACAVAHAERGAIATLGVVPTRPETGYGYIRTGEVASAPSDSLSVSALSIEHFVEKPNAERAADYLASGRYLWNSGIFVVRASVWLRAIEAFAPRIHDQCVSAVDNSRIADGHVYLSAEEFAACPSDSIDYAVMERIGTRHRESETMANEIFVGVVVPLASSWSDVGSWSELWSLADKDENGNAAVGKAMFEHASSTYVHAGRRLVACVGTRDIVVVDTPDAILVADRACAQEVKAVVNRLNQASMPEAREHRKVFRPWGFFDSVEFGDRYQVKRLVVDPGARLSLQLHHHRAEQWVVVRGTARAQCGDTVTLLTEGQTMHIPIGTVHRLENPGNIELEVIEVQTGGYLGEDDIVRLDDAYGRE